MECLSETEKRSSTTRCVFHCGENISFMCIQNTYLEYPENILSEPNAMCQMKRMALDLINHRLFCWTLSNKNFSFHKNQIPFRHKHGPRSTDRKHLQRHKHTRYLHTNVFHLFFNFNKNSSLLSEPNCELTRTPFRGFSLFPFFYILHKRPTDLTEWHARRTKWPFVEMEQYDLRIELGI